MLGPIEADPEYQVIVDSNNLIVEIDNEISKLSDHWISVGISGVNLSLDVIHKYVRDLYSKRFPELESLVHTALEYVRTVQVPYHSSVVWGVFRETLTCSCFRMTWR